MNALRWRIRDILELIVLLAVALSSYHYFYARSGLEWQFVFGIYLLMLSIATLDSIRVAPGLRQFWQGYAVFGWLYFIFALRDSSEVNSFSEAQIFRHRALMGILLALVCAIAAHLFLPVSSDSKSDRSTD